MFNRLEIFTFGGFEARIGGEPVTGFRSRKVMALLAYLAANPQPQRREALAELFWPERSQGQSLSNLRVVLSDLKKILQDSLDIHRDQIGLKRNADLWIDVADLEARLVAGQKEKAVELYRGDFLQAFYVPDAREFENWITIEREKYRQKILLALQGLISTYRNKGAYSHAISFARRLVELDKLDETGQLELMRLMALTGRRGAALAQYSAYRSLLKEELCIEPSPEMAALYTQLQSGELTAAIDPPVGKPESLFLVPDFLAERTRTSQTAKHIFVGRDRELSILESHLRQVYDGRGKVIFISGEAGSGKTTLLSEFAGRAQEMHPDLVATFGICTVFSGTGDPFLPFQDVLALLIGDVERWVSTGKINPEQAKRLLEFRKSAAKSIVENGPDLIGRFIPARLLASPFREEGVDWHREPDIRLDPKTAQQDKTTLQPTNIFQQYADVIVDLARQRPLLILLEDLHWADPSSVSLLSHLSNRISTSRILMIGTYRSEEVLRENHPFGSALSEFARLFGNNQIDLSRQNQAANENFVNILIDAWPNKLDENFRRRLSRLTGGHALFTVELLNDLQERGLLIQDADGDWIEGEGLDWEILPVRVEAILERRARRLEEEMRAVLKVACIEGEEFTAEVVSQVLGLEPFELVRRLSGELARRSRLISEAGVVRAGAQRLSMFHFRHGIFQRYFYHQIGEAERAYLHERVGLSLENLHRDQPQALAAISSRLARHFQEAGNPEKAIDYLLMAGSRATQLGASREAAEHLQRGIELLPQLSQVEMRNRKELELQLALCAPLQALKGYAAPEVRRAYLRVRELSVQMGMRQQLLPNLYFLRTFHHTLEERRMAYEVAEETINSTDKVSDPCLISLAHWALGSELSYRGDFRRARYYLDQASETFDGQAYGWLVNLYGNDPGIASRARLSWVLWFLGYPDQARQHSQAARAMAEGSKNPLVQGFAIGRAGVMFHQIIREIESAQYWNEKSKQYSEGGGVELFSPAETILAGWIKVERGKVEEGIERMAQGLDAWRASGAEMHLPHYLGLFASACSKAGQIEKGLELLDEALAVAESNNEHYYEAELYRIQGELLFQKGDEADVEAVFQKSIEIARKQEAKSWELRTTMSLGRLWQKQGRREEARICISNLYDWFTEGFDTPDLKDARCLLATLKVA